MSVIPGCMNPKVIADAIRDSRKFCQALPKSQGLYSKLLCFLFISKSCFMFV